MQNDSTSVLPSSGIAIDDRIMTAILSGRILPGERLGEKDLGQIFGVSRTLVREAMMRLSSRGIVAVSPRRGWFVVEPTVAEARETIEARRSVEIGLLFTQKNIPQDALNDLEVHVLEQQKAIDERDLSRRSYLLGQFHVKIAEIFGNPVVVEILELLTNRIFLIAALYQSTDEAQISCNNHREMVLFMRKNDKEKVIEIMNRHFSHLDKALSNRSKRITRPIKGYGSEFCDHVGETLIEVLDA